MVKWKHVWAVLALAAAQAPENALAPNSKRTNFASTECAAAIIETNPGVKNSKNVLESNKDTYAMFECSDTNNYMVVELCQDILIDEISLANYEFFSSQFKDVHFEAADSFPAEDAEWFKLGDFETNNTRADQVFAIESPKVWARYLKINFLSHWDNEYYCPLTAIRVHGTTMIDKFKQDDADLSSRQKATEADYTQDCRPDPHSCPVDQHHFQELALPEANFEICATPDRPHPNSLLRCSAPAPPTPFDFSGQKQCCLRPTANATSTPSAVFKESMYESLNKRLNAVEQNLLHNADALAQYRQSVQVFFDDLVETLGKDLGILAEENELLHESIAQVSRQLSGQQTAIYFQTAVLALVVIYLFTPRTLGEVRQAKEWARTRAASLATSDSSSDFNHDNLVSDPDDTYIDLDPRTPSFTPSRPGTPASSLNDEPFDDSKISFKH